MLTPYGLAMRAVVAVLLFVTAVHAAMWGVFRDRQEAPDFKGMLPSVSYAPFEGTAHPDVDNIPSVEKIRADMKKLATLTRAIRLYSSTGGVELVPPIAAHILPYWENFTDKQAVDQAVYLYGLLRDKFPGKRIVIAEFGWPSAGYNLKNADPGSFEQAVVLRNFVTRAEAIGMEYNIVEAIDQPWKLFECGVGPYWGILNAGREPKCSCTGPVVNEAYWKLATIALLVGVLISLPILRLSEATVMQSLMLSSSANGVGAWVATVFAYWNGHYFVFGSAFALTLGLILLVPLVLIAMARIEAIAAVAFGRNPRRLLARRQHEAPAAAAGDASPKLSIRGPAYL